MDQTGTLIESNCLGLVVGNCCHDVLFRDDFVVAETLGGSVSFISSLMSGLFIRFDYVSKIGFDFSYSVPHSTITSLDSRTTLFHASFSSENWGKDRGDRVLRRICACDPINPLDLPKSRFRFGLAVGVAGEINPETLERIIDICDVVIVDIQSLIRGFDPIDGTVKLICLKESGFFHLIPRIRFLKVSTEEVMYLDVEEVRLLCCVVVTSGKDGSRVYWKEGETHIAPFEALQIDPTGAGDSFLGGFAYGLLQGLSVPDAALLGNFFGALTVSQIGLPKIDKTLLQKARESTEKMRMNSPRKNCGGYHFNFDKTKGHEEFHKALSANRLPISYEECNKMTGKESGIRKFTPAALQDDDVTEFGLNYQVNS